MTVTQPAGMAEVKKFTRATWAMGAFSEVARHGLCEVGARTVHIKLRSVLEPKGPWPELRAKLAATYDQNDPGEYLIMLSRKG